MKQWSWLDDEKQSHKTRISIFVANNTSGSDSVQPCLYRWKDNPPLMGIIISKDSKLVLTLDIGYGRLLLDMFAVLEEKGLLSKDTAELYDLLKRQIPQ